MDYAGREILIMDCIDVLQDLKDDYLKYVTNLVKQGDIYVDHYDLEETFSLIFDSLYSQKLDNDSILKDVYKLFNDDKNYTKYIILNSFFFLLKRFSLAVKNMAKAIDYIIYLQNAIETFRKLFIQAKILDEDENDKKKIINFKADSNSMFFSSSIDQFKRVKALNESIDFLNLYNGVPIKCSGRIVEIDENNVLCEVNLMQIVAMKEEGSAYIVKKDGLLRNTKADILSINLSNNTVLLGNFVHIENMLANQRRYPRVHPNTLTRVTLKNKNGTTINGKLYDISQGGIGVVSLENGKFSSGDDLLAEFELTMPKDGKKIKVCLEVCLVIALNYQGSMRYCCEIIKEQAVKQDIIEFAKQREIETLEELNNKVKLYA
ncbi:PilZ domain-containing protein [Campylobacter hyointestinalis subsp. lawsonii CCUG 27631]|uniref:PilZ domain-containing protein n=1 Tax=Campylobacter hyointestinalis TaxID=198 RepID=UPI0007C96133|nr:PilZ domain-containing protein [Campylobacter hyointestinalis]ANE33711.1 PilZ domain-containing protein [Campylobacter hyointestinalis subsp. lawsonii CCUG 27631]